MFVYNKKLQYPVKIANPNPRLAAIIISQYGGPDGELGASLRYLSQRYSMPFDEQKALLTDVGTEELGHLEMVGAIVHQLTRNLKDSQIQDSAFAPYFVDHTAGVYPTAASGFPWNAASMAVKGDPIADLTEDLAAEQKAKKMYEKDIREIFTSDEQKKLIIEKSSRVIYPSDQLNFPCYIAFAAFRKNKLFGLYINKIHTKKDVNFDEANIDHIRNGVCALIEKIN